MTSQWEKLCSILDRAESMPAKRKTTYLKSALAALAVDSQANITSSNLKTMTSKMQPKASGVKTGKKRRSPT